MKTHASVECIPVDDDVFARAPLVFKQEIGEAESEWSQHHAMRLMDTSQKGLRGCIPRQFPYFSVEFGYRKGFAHIIDDESKWKGDFGRSVMVGLMGLKEEDMYRKARKEGNQAQVESKSEFLSQWEAFDWTQQLDA
jgi:transposase